jgi:hypothetical protein
MRMQEIPVLSWALVLMSQHRAGVPEKLTGIDHRHGSMPGYITPANRGCSCIFEHMQGTGRTRRRLEGWKQGVSNPVLQPHLASLIVCWFLLA